MSKISKNLVIEVLILVIIILAKIRYLFDFNLLNSKKLLNK